MLFRSALTVTSSLTIDTLTTLLPNNAYINSIRNLNLNGGTLASGATTGFTNTFGTLTLLKSSDINLGTGLHTIKFDSSSNITWTPTAKLTINGWQGVVGGEGTAGKVYVGLSNLALTGTQKFTQTQFNISGNFIPANQISSGEIIPYRASTGNTTLYFVRPNSSQTGLWSDINNWSTSANGDVVGLRPAPTDGDTVVIQSGNTVTIDIANARCKVLYNGGVDNPAYSFLFGNNTTSKGTGAIQFTSSNTSLTVTNLLQNGTIGNNNYTGSITMTNGATLEVEIGRAHV